MERKHLYTVGNLVGEGFRPFAVLAEQQFGSVEVHGPFTIENEANWYAHDLVKDGAEQPQSGPYVSVKVVQIDTPLAGAHIVRKDGAYEYAA